MAILKNESFPIELDIVSDGDTNYAQNLSLQLGLNEMVRFHNTKTTSEVAAMLGQSDALLMFSNYENFPCVIAEAMMSGKPVLSSNVNGIPEHVNETNGILVSPRDEVALAQAIKDWHNGKKRFSDLEIRKYAEEHFGYRSVGKKFDEVYREVLGVG
jgi:glycosyltransferase involved in cell wall biosynthesis